MDKLEWFWGELSSFGANWNGFGAKQEAFGAKQEASGANQNGSGQARMILASQRDSGKPECFWANYEASDGPGPRAPGPDPQFDLGLGPGPLAIAGNLHKKNDTFLGPGTPLKRTAPKFHTKRRA